jgi:hypothetical protein
MNAVDTASALENLGKVMENLHISDMHVSYDGSFRDINYLDVSGDRDLNDDERLENACREFLDSVVDFREHGSFGDFDARLENGEVRVKLNNSHRTMKEVSGEIVVPTEHPGVQAVLDTMKRVGAKDVRVGYSGQGDSMDWLGLTSSDAPLDRDDKVEITQVVEDLIHDKLYGFWNDEGGEGEFSFTDKGLRWEHFNRRIESVDENSREFSRALSNDHTQDATSSLNCP